MFGGLFGRQAGQAVSQMVTLNHSGKEFLMSVHDGGQLRWGNTQLAWLLLLLLGAVWYWVWFNLVIAEG